MVMWIVIGLAAWLTLAVIVGLAVVATLTDIGLSLSELPEYGDDTRPRRPTLRLVN